MQKISTQVLNTDDIVKYLKENTENTGRGFAVVKTSLKVWKQTYTKGKDGYDNVIVALEIPVGAEIYSEMLDDNYLNPSQKSRASEAKVIKQFNVGSVKLVHSVSGYSQYLIEKYSAVKKSKPYHNSEFVYGTGETVEPTYGFSKEQRQCCSGIHFFVNLSSALEY